MRNPHQKRPYSQNNSLIFSALEQRSMLAAIIEYNAATQVVTIEGTNAQDQVLVNYVDGYDNIRVVASDANSVNRLQLPAWQIQAIHFEGNDGDDQFRNNTHRESVVNGGNGNDSLFGGWGGDFLFGEAGNDFIVGRHGSDNLNGGAGSDTLHSGPGNDNVDGSFGNDTITGGSGNNIINGGYGNDLIFGGVNNDVIDGSFGNDAIYAGNGNDIVDGGEGDDVLRGWGGNDELDGGEGKDRLSGDNGEDILRGAEGVDRIFGGHGNDEIFGGDGNDLLFGGAGDDTLIGDDGDDTLYGEQGADILQGFDGNDGLYGGLGETDRLEGGRGADRLLSSVDSNNRLEELVLGWSSEDAIVRFEDLPNYTININGIGNVTFTAKAWTDAEIRTIDQALDVLHHQVSNSTALLKTHQGVTLKFQRAGNLIGQSFEIGGWNQNGVIGLTNSAFRTDLRALAVTYHEVGHNWDQAHENSLATNFEAISSWRNSFAPGYTLSTGGGNWYYRDVSSGFARDYGKWSPYEDYATTWETYFTANYHGSNGWTGTDNVVAAKFANLDAFFARLG